MKRGMEVMEAALAGHCVRHERHGWMEFDKTTGYLRSVPGHGQAVLCAEHLWQDNWEIGVAPAPTKTTDLNEDEAIQAMKDGAIVTDGAEEWRLKPEGDSWRHFSRPIGDTEWTDWGTPKRYRIVSERPDEPALTLELTKAECRALEKALDMLVPSDQRRTFLFSQNEFLDRLQAQVAEVLDD